jgi:MinD superfamily P-loop ATPase
MRNTTCVGCDECANFVPNGIAPDPILFGTIIASALSDGKWVAVDRSESNGKGQTRQ